MAENLDLLRRNLQNKDFISQNSFSILAQLSRLTNEVGGGVSKKQVQELVLLALEQQKYFGNSQELLHALVRKQGLYPYLKNSENELGFKDRIAYEMHRPDNMDDVVMHREQSFVYNLLLQRKSVVLSAPTSFGKSLVIDAVIASGIYSNIVVVVPTIALIDETRRRLFNRFGEIFKIITHTSQSKESRNIFVLTQERVVDFAGVETIVDFFVIDEFYKLDPKQDSADESSRSLLLNQAFDKLYTPGVVFYLLGPNIDGINTLFTQRYSSQFVSRRDYVTVVAEREYLGELDKEERFITLCRKLKREKEPTLVYCSSPASTWNVAQMMLEAGLGSVKPSLQEAADWAGRAYHPEWSFVLALRQGIGIHHGKVPRSLAQYVVKNFDKGEIDFLLCTSTLIEGVNTKAKNVIIYDNRLVNRSLDYFTFNNIAGRAGRMFQHFVGRLFVFGSEPDNTPRLIDVPLVTQSPTVSTSLLVQLKEGTLSDASLTRVNDIRSKDALFFNVIRQNRGIEPLDQIALLNELRDNFASYYRYLNWRVEPDYDQLLKTCELVWNFLWKVGKTRGISSHRMLAFLLNRLRRDRHVNVIVVSEITRLTNGGPGKKIDVNRITESVLDFVRNCAGFALPRYVMALSRIQQFVCNEFGVSAGDYNYYASQLEHSFVPVGIAALDEYGIPIQIGLKLTALLTNKENLDQCLIDVKSLDLSLIALTDFERELIESARADF